MKLKNNLVIAHRGMWDNEKIPENSMKAFERALENQYAIELDVQLTKDNVMVVFHDLNLERMTGIDKDLQKSTYEEIRDITLLPTKEVIPKLVDVLELVNDQVLLDIEIKSTNRISATCEELVKLLKSYQNYVIKSFDPEIVRYLKVHYPSLEVGYLIHRKYAKWWEKSLLQSRMMIHYTKADFLSIHKSLLKKKAFQKLSEKYPISLWTITSEEERKDPNYCYVCNYLKPNKK